MHVCFCKQSIMGMSKGVCVCLSSSTKSPVDSYLCVYVMEALLEVLKKDASPSPIHVCQCTRDQAWVWLCVCIIFTLLQTTTCVCMYMYVETAEQIQLHKVVIVLLIMKYFEVKIVSYLVQLYHATLTCNLTPCNLKTSATERKSSTERTH